MPNPIQLLTRSTYNTSPQSLCGNTYATRGWMRQGRIELDHPGEFLWSLIEKQPHLQDLSMTVN